MTNLSQRPRTLHEVSLRAINNQQRFDPALREFLDVFYVQEGTRSAAIEEHPLNIGDVKDAYLAATAEHLARVYGVAIPPWTDNHGKRLTKPFFAGGLESMKALLFAESPTAFRRRMLFISKDALDRPLRPRLEKRVEPEVGDVNDTLDSGFFKPK